MNELDIPAQRKVIQQVTRNSDILAALSWTPKIPEIERRLSRLEVSKKPNLCKLVKEARESTKRERKRNSKKPRIRKSEFDGKFQLEDSDTAPSLSELRDTVCETRGRNRKRDNHHTYRPAQLSVQNYFSLLTVAHTFAAQHRDKYV